MAYELVGKLNPEGRFVPQKNIAPKPLKTPHVGESVVNVLDRLGTQTNNFMLSKPFLATAARAGEAVAGIPGNIAQGVSSLLGVQNKVPLPTSGDLREGTKALTGQSFEPQSPAEDTYQSFIGDLAALATPIPGLGAANIPLKTAAKVAGAGNIAQHLTRALGASEGTQKFAKGATMLVGSLAGGRAALENQANELYQAGKEVSKNARIPAQPISRSLSNLRDDLARGGITSAKTKVPLEKIQELAPLLESNFVGIPELEAAKTSVNHLLRDKTLEQAWPNLTRLSGVIKEPLREYGKANKAYADTYLAADNLLANLKGPLKAKQVMGDYLGKLSPDFLKTDMAKNLFKGGSTAAGLGGAGYAAIKAPLIAGGVGATALGAAAGSNWLARTAQLMYNDPNALKYYLDAFNAAAQGNLRSVKKNVHLFDNLVQKTEQKEKKSLDNGWTIIRKGTAQ